MTAIGELVISSPVEPWERLGLLVHGDVARVMKTSDELVHADVVVR